MKNLVGDLLLAGYCFCTLTILGSNGAGKAFMFTLGLLTIVGLLAESALVNVVMILGFDIFSQE